MAFDLEVFNKQTSAVITETIDQSIKLFNEASGGAIVLVNRPFEGDFDITSSFSAISGLVRRRNAHGSGTVVAKQLKQLLEVAVKVGAGTPPIEYEPQQYYWIKKNPELAALKIGEQLGKASLADMLNAGISGAVAAIGGNTSAVHDASSNTPSFREFNAGSAKFGDRSSAIRVWALHSTTMHGLFDNALTNNENLFSYDGVNIIRDPFGRLYLVTDSPSLVNTGDTPSLNTLGLVENGLVVNSNDDFNAILEQKTGNENIKATYQAEWSFGVAVKGYAWDMATGGKSPNDTAIATPTNWQKTATSTKDTAGVLVKTKL